MREWNSAKLKEVIKQSDLKRKAIAEKSGIALTYLHSLCAGRCPGRRTITALCFVLNSTPEDLGYQGFPKIK